MFINLSPRFYDFHTSSKCAYSSTWPCANLVYPVFNTVHKWQISVYFLYLCQCTYRAQSMFVYSFFRFDANFRCNEMLNMHWLSWRMHLSLYLILHHCFRGLPHASFLTTHLFSAPKSNCRDRFFTSVLSRPTCELHHTAFSVLS